MKIWSFSMDISTILDKINYKCVLTQKKDGVYEFTTPDKTNRKTTYRILDITTKNKKGLKINNSIYKIPRYAYRSIIAYDIMKKCSKLGYAYEMVDFIHSDKHKETSGLPIHEFIEKPYDVNNFTKDLMLLHLLEISQENQYDNEYYLKLADQYGIGDCYSMIHDKFLNL